MFLEAAHGRLQSHPNKRRANTSKSTNIVVMDSAYMCGFSCVSVEVRLCIYVSIRSPPRLSFQSLRQGRCHTRWQKQSIYCCVVGRDARGSLHGCVGGCGMWLYSIVDPMAGPALAPITTMIYVGCGWKATRGLVQSCVVRIWILLHTTAHRTAGPKQAWGRATAFSWLRLGRKPWASTLMYRRHPDLAVLHRRLGEAPTLA